MQDLVKLRRQLVACVAVLFLATPLLTRGDGPRDNIPENVRRIPPLGIEVEAGDRELLERELKELANTIESLKARKDRVVDELLPDVIIFHRAVSDALEHQEFFAPADIAMARKLLGTGKERAAELAEGRAPWTRQTGLVVRGYVSRIDRSVQPYGLVIPDSYTFTGTAPHRLDLWFHGRGETLSEVRFLDQRMRQTGEFAPKDAFVLHPYGRYSNAFKFAGEVDVLEALDAVRRHYRIDEDRIAVRGFSMGGAACWQFAVHYADHWFAANPGAGFSETPEFLKSFQQEKLSPTWYERKLWHLYDCPDSALNLVHCPTIAYSGELDIQKQAADIMEATLEKEGIDLVHIIGPGTKHSIHPESKLEIERRLASLAERGRERVPKSVQLVTWTLKYNRMHWVTVEALGEHWNRARVKAAINGSIAVEVSTENVTELTLAMPAGWCPLEMTSQPQVTIDGQSLAAPRPKSDRSWECRLHKAGNRWQIGAASDEGLRKRHNLQGPIDDAFMDSFVFVRPTGKGMHSRVDAWARGELEHAIEHWRRHFRGDARVIDDAEVSDAVIADSNFVLFGDPASNAVLAKIADRLPIRWDASTVTVGERRFSSEEHAPILIFPNPLNPARYVVLNSGFTYREYDYLNNARQVPKLPDWAVVDVREPPNSRTPGKIVAADFFGERWEVRPAREE